MRAAHRILLLIFGLAIILPALALLVPQPSTLPSGVGPEEYKFVPPTVALFTWLHLGAALLFLAGLSGFKDRFRNAYQLICGGLVLYGFSLLQFPVLAALNLWQGAWAVNGGKSLPLLLGSLIIFVGLRMFARGVNVKGPLITFWALLSIPILASFAGLLVEDSVRVQFIANVASTLMAIWLVPLTLQIRRAAGPAYSNALLWFSIALAINAFAQGLPAAIIFLHVTEGAFSAIPFAIAGILFVIAGNAFTKISELFYGKDEPAEKVDASAIDAITYLASLASDPKAIDPILDDLRAITVRLQPGQSLTDNNQITLAALYRRLTIYLSTDEPLRIFTEETLSKKVKQRFPRTRTSETIFWHAITKS